MNDLIRMVTKSRFQKYWNENFFKKGVDPYDKPGLKGRAAGWQSFADCSFKTREYAELHAVLRKSGFDLPEKVSM